MPEIKQSPLRPPPDHPLLGKYEIGKLLGCGAFAKVYHARDVRNGQSVAIKIINKNKIPLNANSMSNIKREISIMKKLNHPNIVKLFEVLASKTRIYFVMEFIKGGELFAKIAKHGRFSEDLSRKCFQQLISAVSYCHARGIYHRDLKPENILLDENGEIKVSDFGLSAVTEQIRQDGLLHTLCGTPSYVAPEIISRRGYNGAKIDIWSCGVVLFVLSAGYLPFNDSNLMVMYQKICKGQFKYPRRMSSDLRKFLSKLLCTNPIKRITIDEIKSQSWFKKGYIDVRFYDDKVEENNNVGKSLINAFDLISFSSGLDLSALFNDKCNSMEDSERLVVAETSPERIIEKVEELMKEENGRNSCVRLKKMKEYGVELQGQFGKFSIVLEVYQLADKLLLVEAKRIAGEAIHFDELWKKKIKPIILGQLSTNQQGIPVASELSGGGD
ncbi:hypothetical protein LIER_15809 [Lithospermum erythrorhizon]|uniref:non-specific serine/threonine protein kinase n=1 Tax=Lithospermum erythrorhizon TaxID=34254 RepID=A0AAV3Q8D7_LITER